MRIIGGEFGGRRLRAPKGAATRPTSARRREAVFSILDSRAALAGACVLDLFAGSGALGLEALSRGARHACFVEQAAAACAALADNIAALEVDARAEVLRGNATRLPPADTGFDVVFLDPPYGKGLAEQALISAMQGGWLAAGARIIVEESRRARFTAPDGLTETSRRPYGETEIIFLAWG